MQERSHKEILKAVRRIEISTKQAVNAQLAGHYHSVFKGQGMAFSDVRAYAPGDDIRSIDWNVSARHQDQGLFVKQFHEERELTCVLLVDMSGSVDFGTRGQTKRSLLAHVGALLSFSAIKNNDRVGLLLFTDEVELYLSPRKGTKHVLRVIRELVEFKPKGKGTSLPNALAYLSRVQKKRSVVFLLSDFIDPAFEQGLKVAMARHDLIALTVHDPAERALPDVGLLELVDAETGARQLIDTSSAAVREAYARLRSGQASKRRLRQLGLDVVELSTAEDFVRPLVGFFRARSARLRTGR